MNCHSCGSSITSFKCDYCGSTIQHKNVSEEISLKQKQFDKLLKELKFYESPKNLAPQSLKEKKIIELKKKIKEYK